MVRLKIDNIECEVPEGATVLDAARLAGIYIPTLCHSDGLPHYTSCMVCLVQDNRTKGFIPSCSTVAQQGMDLSASGNEVLKIRKEAVILLLSEHRAECEAPCRIVCPAGYNIPLMNRLLASGDIVSAVNLSLSELNTYEIHCFNCPAYCENACRRKKIDLPVSIRNLQLFINQQILPEKKPVQNQENSKEEIEISKGKNINSGTKNRRFRSLIGKLDDNELKEWLKECVDANRYREIHDNSNAILEAKSCMHCDCRASEDCRLRDIAGDLQLKDPRGKLTYSPAVKKINLQTNLIFENAKCIKCGLCVRVSEAKNGEMPLCFMNRGFISIISEPMTVEFVETMKTTAEECIKICPTGALAHLK